VLESPAKLYSNMKEMVFVLFGLASSDTDGRNLYKCTPLFVDTNGIFNLFDIAHVVLAWSLAGSFVLLAPHKLFVSFSLRVSVLTVASSCSSSITYHRVVTVLGFIVLFPYVHSSRVGQQTTAALRKARSDRLCSLAGRTMLWMHASIHHATQEIITMT